MAKDGRLTKRQLKKLVKEQSGAVKKDPNNLVARLKLAGALKELGKGKEAINHYQAVAKAYASTGKLVQAISVYKGILEIKPGHQDAESALSELSARRAQEIKAKSMPRLQQQDDGRWVMPTQEDVSEEEGTDPGAGPTSRPKLSTPSVLRLPAPLPTGSAPPRRRRGRRTRSSVAGLGTPSSPTMEGADDIPGDAASSQPDGFQPSLPSLAEHESPGPGVEPPTPPPPPRAPGEIREGAIDSVPPPPASSRDRDLSAPLPENPTKERDLAAEAARSEAELAAMDPAMTTQQDVVAWSPEDEHLVLTAEAPPPQEREGSPPEDDPEEPTSPGPTGYTETIRKSAVGIDVSAALSSAAPSGGGGDAPRAHPGPRRTLMGVPTPGIPELRSSPQEGLEEAPASEEGRGRPPSPSRLTPVPEGSPDSKRTVQMDRPPEMPGEMEEPRSEEPAQVLGAEPGGAEAPGGEALAQSLHGAATGQALGEADEVSTDGSEDTLGDVFDEEEAAFWSELEGASGRAGSGGAGRAALDSDPASSAGGAQPSPAQPSPPRHTLKASPAPVPEARTRQEVAPASDPEDGEGAVAGSDATSEQGGGQRAPSRMTLPMGAAAIKRAVEEESGEEPAGDSAQPKGAAVVRLEDIALFRDLSESSREMLASRLIRREESAGAVVVREGDPGNALFVVSSGRVTVTKRGRSGGEVELASLGPGAFFGEFALLSDRKRHATVTMSEPGVLFEISRKVIAGLTKSDPSFGSTLRQFYRRRLLGTLVHSAPFFEPLTPKEREALMGRLRFRRIASGTKIITEGEPGGGFFLILIGEVEVTRTRDDGSVEVLSKLGDGSYFGEMSLLKGGNAVATVTTVTPTEIVQLAAAEFYRILSRYPQIWEEVNLEAKRRELANLQILSGRRPDGGPSDDSVVM